MKELSLHILDLAQNSIKAKATELKIKIVENLQDDYMKIIIEDNGEGVKTEFLENILDPFTTTRTTRKVGLGLPLFQAAAERCDGKLEIDSEIGKGTKVKATFKHSHIDRAPLGDIEGTIAIIIQGNPDLEVYYQHIVNNNKFDFSTVEVRKELEGVPINEPAVIKFIKEYLTENIQNLKGAVR